jgi:hypothetical protein
LSKKKVGEKVKCTNNGHKKKTIQRDFQSNEPVSSKMENKMEHTMEEERGSSPTFSERAQRAYGEFLTK